MSLRKIHLLLLVFITLFIFVFPTLLTIIDHSIFSISDVAQYWIVKISMLIALLLFIKRNYTNVRDLYINWGNIKHTVFAIMLGLLLQPIYIFINKLNAFFFITRDWVDNSTFIKMMVENQENLSIATIIIAGLITVIGEEFLFRSILLERLKLSNLRIPMIILISSLWFALIHLNIQQFFYALFMGAILALLTLYTKSILPAIIVHFMVNEVASLLIKFSHSKYESYINFTTNSYVLIGSITLLIAIFSYLYMNVNKRHTKSTVTVKHIDRYSMIIIVFALIYYSLQLIDWLKSLLIYRI